MTVANMDNSSSKFQRILKAAGEKRLREHEKGCGICKDLSPDKCIIRKAIERHVTSVPQQVH